MITLAELDHRLTSALDHIDTWHDAHAPLGPTRATAYASITADLRDTHKRLARAHTTLLEHQPGYPSISGGTGSGNGGISDRTLTLATAATDPATAALDNLDRITQAIAFSALHLALLDGHPRIWLQTLENDAQYLCNICRHWGTPPAFRECTHCAAVNGYRAPVALGRYKEHCRSCGDWRAVNGQLPGRDILHYLQRGDPIPEPVLARNHAVIPNSRKRRRKKTRR